MESLAVTEPAIYLVVRLELHLASLIEKLYVRHTI